MSISVACPLCNAKLKVSDQAAGKTLKGTTCPKCAKQFDITIPSMSAAPVPTASFAPPLAIQASPLMGSTAPLAQSSLIGGKFLGLFGCFAKAAVKVGLNHLTLGIVPVGDMVIEAYDMWNKEKPSEEEKQKEMREMINATVETRDKHLEEMIQSLVGEKSAEDKRVLKVFLNQIPSCIQRSMRSSPDSNGNAPPPSLIMRSAEDLAALLPEKMPRFKPGDHPHGVGDWELEELLGTGGFGEVWKARNPNLPNGRPVALKFCLDKATASVLRNEAEMLDHVMREGKRQPGIVTLLHTYLNADPPCLEYEYVSGGDLAGLIRELHRPPQQIGPRLIEQATEMMRQLFQIVAFAHHLKPPVVHRDLKPANILVQRSARGKITLRVADFGISGIAANQALAKHGNAAAIAQSMTASVKGTFTPLYASPQQSRGNSPDPADDVFALGVIWYQLLNGDLSKGCPSGMRWSERLSERGMPTAMIEMLRACFEDEATDRPADAGVLSDRLAAILREASQPPTTRENVASDSICIEGHRQWINGVAFSPDDSCFVSGSSDKTIRLWDMGTRQELRCFKGHTKTVRSVAFSPNGEHVLSGAFDNTMRLWDIRTGRQLRCFEGHLNDVMSVAFCPNGRQVLSGSKDHTLRLWDLSTGQEQALLKSNDQVWCVAVSADGKFALSDGNENAVILWNLASHEAIRSFQGHTKRVWTVAFSPDSRFALSAGSDKIVRLWDVESGREIDEFKGHKGTIWGLDFSHDGRFAASCARDNTVRIWDLANGKEARCLEGHSQQVMSVAFAHDGRWVLSGSRDNE